MTFIISQTGLYRRRDGIQAFVVDIFELHEKIKMKAFHHLNTNKVKVHLHESNGFINSYTQTHYDLI